MVTGKSPEWLPSGFTEKVKYKNGRRIKYYYNVTTGAKYFSKKDVLSCATSDNGPLATPQTPNGDDNALSSGSKVDAESDKTNDSPDWLPDGWTTEERTRNSGSRRGSVYKVYTEASSGKRFYSRASVTQYLGTEDRVNTVTVQTKSENVVEQSPHMSPQCLSMTNTGGTPVEKTKGNSFHTLDKVDEASPKCLSMTNTGDIPEEENKDNSIKTLDKLDEPSPKCLSMTNIGGILEEENKDNFIKMPDNKVDEPSQVCISMTNIGGTSEEVKKDNSVKLDKVDDPSPHLSMKNTGAISREKKKGTSYKPVSIVSSADDDLPPGWIKEIVTSKCGIKTRRDPVGDDEFGHMLAEILKENKVERCGMRFNVNARNALAFVTFRADGEHEFMFYHNPSADMLLTEDELDKDLIKKLVGKTHVKLLANLTISGLARPMKTLLGRFGTFRPDFFVWSDGLGIGRRGHIHSLTFGLVTEG